MICKSVRAGSFKSWIAEHVKKKGVVFGVRLIKGDFLKT